MLNKNPNRDCLESAINNTPIIQGVAKLKTVLIDTIVIEEKMNHDPMAGWKQFYALSPLDACTCLLQMSAFNRMIILSFLKMRSRGLDEHAWNISYQWSLQKKPKIKVVIRPGEYVNPYSGDEHTPLRKRSRIYAA